MVNTILCLFSFVETPRKFIISTDEDPSLRIESSAIINLRGVSTKLNKYKLQFAQLSFFTKLIFCIVMVVGCNLCSNFYWLEKILKLIFVFIACRDKTFT